jgi:hypothetical protein
MWPSSDDPNALTMEVELLRLVVVPSWLRLSDPHLPGVFVLGVVAGLVPRLCVPGCDDGPEQW